MRSRVGAARLEGAATDHRITRLRWCMFIHSAGFVCGTSNQVQPRWGQDLMQSARCHHAPIAVMKPQDVPAIIGTIIPVLYVYLVLPLELVAGLGWPWPCSSSGASPSLPSAAVAVLV